jgi:hypothetical protein
MLVDQRQGTGATPTGRREPISQLSVPCSLPTSWTTPPEHRDDHDDPWCGRHTRQLDAGSARRVPDPQARRVAPVKLPRFALPGDSTEAVSQRATGHRPCGSPERASPCKATVPSLTFRHPDGVTPGRAFHTSSPVLLLIVARVLWTARPPARPALGAEATTAEPAGPMTFRCPLAVRSTCPPARCTAATISFASLERQRFGVACFFSAMADDPQHPKDTSRFPSWTAHPLLASPTPPRSDSVVQRAQPVGSCSVRAGSLLHRSSRGSSGRQRSPMVQRNRRSPALQLMQLG